jgi:hypothetical protein
MTVPSATADSGTLDFDMSSPTEIIYPTSDSWTSWNVYFSNTDTTNCPITSCSLFESGCSTSMTNPVSIGGSTPWLVTARRDDTDGYT